jgi:hypothetical protein
MGAWSAFRAGIARAFRYRWILVVALAVNLISALALVALPAGMLAGPPAHRAIRQAADGVDAWMVIEALMSAAGEAALGGNSDAAESRLATGMLLALLTMALLPLLAWPPGAFLSGGALLVYAEAPQPFRWRRFLWGCWRWFGVFLLLDAALGLAFAVVFGLALTFVLTASIAAGWVAWVALPLLAVAALVWLALAELTHAIAVADGTRNVFRALARAATLLFRRLPAVVGFYGLALLLTLLLHGIFRLGLLPLLPLSWWPLVLVTQQLYIIGRLWARLARLAGGVALYQGKEAAIDPPTAPQSDLVLS